MWRQHTHHRYWPWLRKLANRPELDFYELRHCSATMLLERDATPWDVAQQLGHTDGGQLVVELYGHPSEAGARARLLAAWAAQTGPVPLSGARRGAQASEARKHRALQGGRFSPRRWITHGRAWPRDR
jgi:hypothetical protein